jgi:predicted ATP-grasp superfamily ATP-dependent carboligase
MDAMPKPTMKSSVLRAVLRTWRALKNARMAFFNGLTTALHEYFTRYNLHRRMQTLTRTLILVGASVRAAAFSAARAGYRPYSIDLFADCDLTALGPAVKIARYPADFFPAIEAAPSAPWIYTGGLENYPRLVDRLSQFRPLVGNRGDVLRKVRSPTQLMQTAREAGCQYPLTIFDATTAGEMDDKSRVQTSQWLVKPLRSSGGVGIRVATADDLIRLPRGCYLQRHIAGDSQSAVFVAAAGQAKFLGATKQLVGGDFGLSRPFLYAGSVGPIVLSDEDRARMHSLGNLLVDRFGLVGLFNIDFVRNEAGLWPLEVNPRYSASIEVLERACEFLFINLHVDACESGRLSDAVATKTSSCAGKAVVYASTNGVVPEMLNELVNDWNTNSEWPGVADLPRVGERIRRGQPVVTVFAEGDSPGRLETELRRRVATIERLLADS